MMLAGWVNEQHRAVHAYLKEENRVLRELHGHKPLSEVGGNAVGKRGSRSGAMHQRGVLVPWRQRYQAGMPAWYRPGLPSDPRSGCGEGPHSAQGWVILDHQLPHVARIHDERRREIWPPACDGVDKDPDVGARRGGY